MGILSLLLSTLLCVLSPFITPDKQQKISRLDFYVSNYDLKRRNKNIVAGDEYIKIIKKCQLAIQRFTNAYQQ